MNNPQGAPGWYDDASSSGAERYWDGHDWTSRRRPKRSTTQSSEIPDRGFPDPLAASPQSLSYSPPGQYVSPPAGWYAAPNDPRAEEYWNGFEWDGMRRPVGGPPHSGPPFSSPPSGFPYPESRENPWQSGSGWSANPYQPQGPVPVFQLGPQEKSSGIAVLLTVLWPGAGHLYLGLSKKAIPYVVANAIGLGLGVMLFILLPISFVIWLVTLVMTVGSVTDDTNLVNDAIRRGQRIQG